MRLLIDENLSESLVASLGPLFPDSLHVRLLGLGGASDWTVWNAARENGCALLTRDEDFLQLSVLHGHPPKVVLLRIGNCSNASVVLFLTERIETIRAFESDTEAAFLGLG